MEKEYSVPFEEVVPGVPTKAMLPKLMRLIKQGKKAAVTPWLRAATYYGVIEQLKLSPAEAAAAALHPDLADIEIEARDV